MRGLGRYSSESKKMERPSPKLDLKFSIRNTAHYEEVDSISSLVSRAIAGVCNSKGEKGITLSDWMEDLYVARGIDDDNFSSAASTIASDIFDSILIELKGKPFSFKRLGVTHESVSKLILETYKVISA